MSGPGQWLPEVGRFLQSPVKGIVGAEKLPCLLKFRGSERTGWEALRSRKLLHSVSYCLSVFTTGMMISQEMGDEGSWV